MIRYLPIFLILISCKPETQPQRESLFNDDWEFIRDIKANVNESFFKRSSDLEWENVSLPHTANIEPLTITGKQWQGTCFYRKFFNVDKQLLGKHIAINFEGAMHEADIYLNGRFLEKHVGGYLPFYIDLTGKLDAGENCLLLRLNNENNPLIPPGKPLEKLDFNYYSGIYRNAWMIVKDKLHISDPVYAQRTAGGGVFIAYDSVSDDIAVMKVKTELKNEYTESAFAVVRLRLADESGSIVSESISDSVETKSGEYATFHQRITIQDPKLWSPEQPYLYTLTVEALHNGIATDVESVRTGVRTIHFDPEGFYLNGEKMRIRGTNRHQEFPYIGYALSDNAQYRDAMKIKEAGFNFVRLSHYPHSKAFMNACDELGLMTMNAIPGWQFFGGEEFQENSFQDIRDMARRDRNHPSVILWEASLNESGMTKNFMDRAHQIVHEEIPLKDTYTCGWTDYAYDLFIPARQHAKPPHYWNNYTGKPLLIAEYGDWEYYAQNAGFNQSEFQDLKEEERTSRQLRGYGEIRLAQQALNYQEAHNDNLKGNAAGDANWLMFDYNRGYAPDIEASGISDIFRLPKFAFYFYQSQNGPKPDRYGFGKPMTYIASYWTAESSLQFKVYSNCEEVALYLNDSLIAKQKPDTGRIASHLIHPPFSFRLDSFEPGTLRAIGFIDDKEAAESSRSTPGNPARIIIDADLSGKQLQSGVNDAIFLYASVVDDHGIVVPDAANEISFTVDGGAELIGHNPIAAEAGIATILLKAGKSAADLKITAASEGLEKGETVVQSR